MAGKTIAKRRSRSALSTDVTTLPSSGRIVAVVVGIECYQKRDNAGLPRVDYARNDVEGFADALREIYPEERLEVSTFIDNDATQSNIRYELLQATESLEENDVFIFYYAGHGFHGAGGNRITAWDTNAHHIDGTTLLLKEVLIERITESHCRRAIAFVDACATKFEGVLGVREVITSLDSREFRDFLTSADYCALFLSCKPGQKSYGNLSLKHGVWTYFLLMALRGKSEKAIGPERYLIDGGLRDYLAVEVPKYITNHTDYVGRQTPQAMITATNSFAIREVPIPPPQISATGDLRAVELKPAREFLEGVDEGPIKSLSGFDRKRRHFVPATVNPRADQFVRDLLAEDVEEEMQGIYEDVKNIFGLRKQEIQKVTDRGHGSLDTEFFRFMIESGQHRKDAEDFQVVRRLVLRENSVESLEKMDSTFGRKFDRAVVEVDGSSLNYDDLVDFFEDIEDAHGGRLRDEEHKERLTYTTPEGIQIRISVPNGRMTVTGNKRQTCSGLLSQVHQFRFGVSGKTRLLLS